MLPFFSTAKPTTAKRCLTMSSATTWPRNCCAMLQATRIWTSWSYSSLSPSRGPLKSSAVPWTPLSWCPTCSTAWRWSIVNSSSSASRAMSIRGRNQRFSSLARTIFSECVTVCFDLFNELLAYSSNVCHDCAKHRGEWSYLGWRKTAGMSVCILWSWCEFAVCLSLFIVEFCNLFPISDLLRRLSRTQNTVFCGQILLFLAKFFPFSERSGLNVISEFNLDNKTVYSKESDVEKNGNGSEAMEVDGEIKAIKIEEDEKK